ncbi:unnamed protein product [Staurois parvus]|uniref:Uncharacterized protein n=1 Tax=Staurois parvus TaxID=386267 RepID=A0ABN9ALR1_9NEOB|nr:unnamed protein product [Staurois parvus]
MNTRANQRDADPAPGLGTVPDHIRRSVFILKDYVHRTDREPIVGLDYVLEYRLQDQAGKSETKYFCEICEMDSDLMTMMEHLGCYRHRKLYLMKAYPYVLKAPSSSKEDRTQFMRRMAMEIEREEGTKMYKSDPTVRMTPMKSKNTQQSKRKSRWDYEGDRQKRMKKALEYLDSFEIDNDSEATTVTRLTEKLIAELKYHSDKLKEEALFPAKVAKAKNIAMSIMQKAPRQQNPGQKNPGLKGAPENIKQNMAMPGGPQPTSDSRYWPPNPAFPQRPHGMENPQNAKFNSEPQTGQVPEESKFFKKLKSLLSAVPQNSTQVPDDEQMHSKLMMLKALLSDKRASLQNTQGNQLPLQGTSMMQDMAGTENVFMNQHNANMGQFGQNVMMQMASMAQNAPANQNSLMQMAALLQNRQMNAFLPENQDIQNQEYFPMDNSSGMPMDQSAYQQPYMEQQPGFPNIPQSQEGFGYDDPMAGNYGNNNMGQYNDFTSEQAPYTRVSLSPSKQRSEGERFRGNSYDRDSRQEYRSHESRSRDGGRSGRSLDEPAWAERERNMPYGKRTRLGSDHTPKESTDGKKRRSDDRGSLDMGAGNLSVDLLKRIRGKDLFTVSAILSEYADGQ